MSHLEKYKVLSANIHGFTGLSKSGCGLWVAHCVRYEMEGGGSKFRYPQICCVLVLCKVVLSLAAKK